MSTVVMVDRGGFQLAVDVWGGPVAAPWLVLSNSLGASSFMWRSQRDLLTRRYRVLAYDTRGHGASDAPQGPYSFEDLTGDVIAILDHFGVRKASFMGLSLGGMTGLGLAIHHTDRFDRIVCCNARADSPPPFRQNWVDRIATIDAEGLQSILAGTMERWFVRRYQEANPTHMKQIHAMFLATSPVGYKGCAEALKTLDYLKDLPKVALPVLYVAGEKDLAAPAAAMRSMAAVTPGSVYAEIPDAAHLPNIDNSPAFAAAIAPFLGLN